MSSSKAACLSDPRAPQESLIAGISDEIFAVVWPSIVYFVASVCFQFISDSDFFPEYRIHSRREEQLRNRISRWTCIKGVVRYHIIQLSIGIFLVMFSGTETGSDSSCERSSWTNYLSSVFRTTLSRTLSTIDPPRFGLNQRLYNNKPNFGTLYASPSSWIAILPGKSIYLAGMAVIYIAKTLSKFLIAYFVMDTWVYFAHRIFHTNKTLYRETPQQTLFYLGR